MKAVGWELFAFLIGIPEDLFAENQQQIDNPQKNQATGTSHPVEIVKTEKLKSAEEIDVAGV